jgi:ADP-heptose:LPS heptosyltransferase
MKLLIISLAGIGDTLFATPLIHELRVNFPGATIDALVLWSGSKDLLDGNPHLNSVYQKNLIKHGKAETLQFLWQLRKNHYDVSINTHPQSRIHYRLVARLIGAPTRISHEYDHATVLDRLLVNRMIRQDYQRHSIENNLAFLGLLDAKPSLARHDYEIYLSPAELAWAEELVVRHGLSGRKWIGLHVGSGGTKNLALRRWPLASYIELVKRLNQTRPELAVLLFGGPEEKSDHERLLAQTGPGRVLQPETKNLRQAAALLKTCHLFLSVDTALMHLAAAMKVPKQIVIETPTWNKPIEPYNNPFTLVRNPAVAGRNLEYYRYDGLGIRGTDQELLACMASVSVEAVHQAVEEALGNGR